MGVARLRVLAVDDSAAMLVIIGTYLKGSTYEVVETARDGKTAVEKFDRLRPDVVLLDVVMPQQSGPETLREIMKLSPTATVGMVSSFGTEDVVDDCLRTGARGFLNKPFSRDDLLKFMERLVGKR
jgi:two-component system, chemotaxis family, chemotaxis protein CheY